MSFLSRKQIAVRHNEQPGPDTDCPLGKASNAWFVTAVYLIYSLSVRTGDYVSRCEISCRSCGGVSRALRHVHSSTPTTVGEKVARGLPTVLEDVILLSSVEDLSIDGTANLTDVTGRRLAAVMLSRHRQARSLMPPHNF